MNYFSRCEKEGKDIKKKNKNKKDLIFYKEVRRG